MAKLTDAAAAPCYRRSVHRHTPAWPTADLGCSTPRAALQMQEKLLSIVLHARLKRHCTSPATAPLLKPTATNTFFSKKTGLFGVRFLASPSLLCKHTKGIPAKNPVPTAWPCTSIPRESQPPNVWVEFQGLNRSYSLNSWVYDNKFWRSPLLVQVQGFSPLANSNRRNSKCKKTHKLLQSIPCFAWLNCWVTSPGSQLQAVSGTGVLDNTEIFLQKTALLSSLAL